MKYQQISSRGRGEERELGGIGTERGLRVADGGERDGGVVLVKGRLGCKGRGS